VKESSPEKIQEEERPKLILIPDNVPFDNDEEEMHILPHPFPIKKEV